MSPDRRHAVMALALIVAAALWLRLGHLGRDSFFVDEYLHAGAAQKIVEAGGRPEGGIYERALPYTYLVAASFRVLGVSEWSARLPSAIAGTLLVLLTFAVGRCWFGTWCGVLAAALVALSPVCVSTARLCRMYSSFELLYLAVLFAYERGWESRDVTPLGRFLWRLATPLLFYASCRLHLLTANLVAGLAVYWVAMLAWVRDWRYAGYLAAACVVAGLAFATVIDFGELRWNAAYLPAWQAVRADDGLFYVRTWGQAYPWLWWIAPSAFLFVCLQHGRTGFLLLSQFAIPFALHSLVFRRKELRYVAELFPLLALSIASFLVLLAEQIGATARAYEPRWRSLSAPLRVASAILLLETGALVVGYAMLPSLRLSVSLEQEASVPNWRAAYAFVSRGLRSGDALLASVADSAAFYLPRLGVRLQAEETAGGAAARGGETSEPWAAWYGSTWQTSVADLQRAVDRHARGWLVTEPSWFHNPVIVSPAVRQYVEEHLQLQSAFEPPVLVFAWDRGVAARGR